MEEEPLVSDLVLHVLEASSSAISKHFSIAFEATKDFDAIRRKCLSFDGGEMQDLEDSDGIAKGFDHDAISEIFRGFAYRPNSAHGVNRHIWGADDDHHLKSLVRTGVGRKRERSQEAGSTDDEQRRARIHSRTRVSALVQQALLRSRRVVQFEKASTAIKDTDECHVFTPSPFYIAKQILTNPISPATEAYATAALNIEMLRRFRPRFGEINLNHQTIQRALELIWNRAFTSKPIRSSGDARGETLYLCHHLAMNGIRSRFVSIPHLQTPQTHQNCSMSCEACPSPSKVPQLFSIKGFALDRMAKSWRLSLGQQAWGKHPRACQSPLP